MLPSEKKVLLRDRGIVNTGTARGYTPILSRGYPGPVLGDVSVCLCLFLPPKAGLEEVPPVSKQIPVKTLPWQNLRIGAVKMVMQARIKIQFRCYSPGFSGFRVWFKDKRKLPHFCI